MNTSVPQEKYPEIVNLPAYKSGYGAFFNGQRGPKQLTTAERRDVNRRLYLLVRTPKSAERIEQKFREQGIRLVDFTDDNGQLNTRAEITVMATCPYKAHTYAAKEWQRGYNAAYYQNLERNKNAGYSYYVADSRRGPGKRSANARCRPTK